MECLSSTVKKKKIIKESNILYINKNHQKMKDKKAKNKLKKSQNSGPQTTTEK